AAQRFTYRTDAGASGRGYASAEAAIEAAIEAGDWATLDSASEQELMEDGGWLCIYDYGVPDIIRCMKTIITGRDGHAYVIAETADEAARLLAADEAHLREDAPEIPETTAADMVRAESDAPATNVSGLSAATVRVIAAAHEHGRLWKRA